MKNGKTLENMNSKSKSKAETQANPKPQNGAQNGVPEASPRARVFVDRLEKKASSNGGEPVGIEKSARGGPREKLSEENIEKMRKFWRAGASVPLIESLTPWSKVAIQKYTKDIPQAREETPRVNSPGPKSPANVPVVSITALSPPRDPLVVETKPSPVAETKPIVQAVLGTPPEASGGYGTEEPQMPGSGNSDSAKLATRWSQMFEVTMDPNIILPVMSDSMSKGFYNDPDGYFKKHVFPTLRQMQILKDSLPPMDDQNFLTTAQLLIRDGISWRKMMRRIQDEAEVKTIAEMGGDPEMFRKLQSLSKREE